MTSATPITVVNDSGWYLFNHRENGAEYFLATKTITTNLQLNIVTVLNSLRVNPNPDFKMPIPSDTWRAFLPQGTLLVTDKQVLTTRGFNKVMFQVLGDTQLSTGTMATTRIFYMTGSVVNAGSLKPEPPKQVSFKLSECRLPSLMEAQCYLSKARSV